MKQKTTSLILLVMLISTLVVSSVLIVEKDAEINTLRQRIKIGRIKFYVYLSQSTIENTTYYHAIVDNDVLFSSTNITETLHWANDYEDWYLKNEQMWEFWQK